MKKTAILFGPKKKIRKIIHFFLNLLPDFSLGLVCLLLAFTNYAPNTWLIGWDNLIPELDFKHNLLRNLFGVWSEYRGPGLLAGQAHLADLPRILILYSANLLGVAPNNLRYVWTFSMLFVGAIGTAHLFRYFIKTHYDKATVHLASFLSGMFYLFNLSTLQLFFIPFDSFVTFYGFLPWFVFSFLTTLFGPKKIRSFIFLNIISLLISPSFFIYTLTIPLLFFLLPFLFEKLYEKGKHLQKVLELSGTIFVSIVPQIYWSLPIIFFVLSGKVNSLLTARINIISSPETLQRNLQFSGLNDIFQLKSYLFEILDLTGNKYAPLLQVWRDHLAQPSIIVAELLLILIIIFGFVFSFRQKINHGNSLATATLFTIFFMAGASLPIINQVPLFSEALRSPFTKFSYTLALSFSLYFGLGSLLIMDLFSFLHHRFTYFLTAFSLSIIFVIFMTPAFTGNLISPSMRVKVPARYFELFDFFKNQNPATRIANFPQYTFWGWNYYDWGYRGSGFLWYGLKQPILDRAFDVWENTSEKYYEKMSAALYNENRQEFESVVDEYAINWILIDKHVIAPASDQDLGNEKLLEILNQSSKFTLAKNINDEILIYKTNVDQRINNFISVSPSVSPQTRIFENISLRPFKPDALDSEWLTLGQSLTTNSPQKLTFPSLSITESLLPVIISYRKTATGLELKISPDLPKISLNNQQIDLPNQPNVINFDLSESHSGLIVGVNDQYFELQLPDELEVQNTFFPLANTYLPTNKNIDLTLYSSTPILRRDLSSPLSAATPTQCYSDKPDRKIEKIVEGKTISLLGTDVVGCLSAPIPTPNSLNQLLSLEFSYYSNTGTPASANLTDTSLGGPISPQPLLAKNKPTFARVYAKARPIPLQANLILEASEIKNPQEIIYQDVQINYFPQLGENDFFLNQIGSTTANITSSSHLKVVLPIVENNFMVNSTPNDNHFLAEAINCDNFHQGKFNRQTTKDGFLYTATGASSCDQLNLKHLPHEINYAIITSVVNRLGMSPTICLENYSTHRCDVYERLNPTLENQVIIQPISNPNEPPGYTLHLFNQSFGNRPVENLIKSVTITPLPLNFLKNITLEPENQKPEVVSSPIVTVNHPAEFLYLTTVTKLNDAPLNLYQTKSPYWKTLEVSENDLKLPLWLLIAKIPHLYFFAKDKAAVLTHNDNNFWYNSWNLPPGTHRLVIFYLPQYLEFIGLAFLPLPLLGLLIYRLFHKKSPR